ncbi:PREDICTED: GATA transcription factor 6-like [Camelina sativa]|uniref:GATA transcription factor n=1 Tax=Camelina sativa TaxID=90675 RepID=A0ABM0YNX8_CAMSA|nr:PREDICTED: GATA transcription factor 6-like [Camelina sativa]XP_010503789.1 PREDICTED: GATA transcription factor 6-like [Camelina sativa]
MESVVELAALKNSSKTLTNGGAQNGDDFSVDDLLNFSNEDDEDALVEDETDLKKPQRKRGLSSDETTLLMSNDFSAVNFPTTELAVPMDDLAELEWLSNFVDDSFTPYSSLAPTKKPVWLTGNRRRSVPPVKEETCFKAPPPPVQIRPKRARTGVTYWSHGSPSSSSSSATSSSSGPPSSPLWLSGFDLDLLDEPRVKKQKKTKKLADQTQTQTQTQTRRCSHCGVQKTPQWRAGPMGAKTLCNACGVRFKSGRLLPEYRPACSPTFSSELHSNHHRKVIEMRRKKETSQEEGDDDDDDDGTTGLNQTVQAVPSF